MQRILSPFKGQGANQAPRCFSSARHYARLSRSITLEKEGVRKSILANFEAEMIKRTAVKVKDSATAAAFLHTENVLQESNSCGKARNNEEQWNDCRNLKKVSDRKIALCKVTAIKNNFTMNLKTN
jgi:hypothetical protein